MSQQIEFIVEWTVTGDMAEFERLAREAAEMVRAEEPRALPASVGQTVPQG